MSKIVVTGGSGLVGQSLKKIMPNAIYLSSKDFDLTTEVGVRNMYLKHKPDIVVHLAAKVGGIIDNINKPAEYYTENVIMNTLLVDYAQKLNVKRFIGILSTCIFAPGYSIRRKSDNFQNSLSGKSHAVVHEICIVVSD